MEACPRPLSFDAFVIFLRPKSMCGNKLVIHVERECLGVALLFFVLNLYHNSTTIKMDRQGSITSLVEQ